MSIVQSLFVEQKLTKHDFFVKKEQYCERLSFISSGYIRIFNTTENKEITQWISSKGYFVTELYSFLFNQRSRWNIQAVTECALYTISKENYSKLPKLMPDWQEIEKRFMASCFIMLEDRVFSHLSADAEERYTLFFEQNKSMFNDVPLHYIASLLGMSPETFSRIRKKKTS